MSPQTQPYARRWQALVQVRGQSIADEPVTRLLQRDRRSTANYKGPQHAA